MKNITTFAISVIASAMILTFTAGTAIAEDTSANQSKLEELTVTGLRRESSVLTAPASISALSAEDLKAKGVSSIEDIQLLVPSLQYGEFLGRRQVAIRGIGEFVDAPGVMVSIDGVVQAIASSSQLAQLDLDRVEVLRGPQGTLYGRNATGGAVSYISAKPTEESEGYVKLGYAEYDHKSIEGVFSGPLGDNFGIRLAANFLDAGEGWIENLQPGAEDLMQGEKSSLRVTLAGELTENLDVTLMYGASNMEGAWDHWPIITQHFALGTASGLPATDIRDTPASPVLFTDEERKVYTPNGLAGSGSKREYQVASLTFDWDIGDVSVKSITAFQDWSDQHNSPADGTSLGLFDRFTDTVHETLTQEVTVSGTHGVVDWIAGLYYMDDDRTSKLFFDFPVPAFFGLPVGHQFDFTTPYSDTESKSVFVDATFSLTDRFRIGAGARRTEEEKVDAHNFAVIAKFPGAPTEIVRFCGPGFFEQKFDDAATTVRASLEYDLNDTGMVYTSYSEGFKVGGVNGSDCNPPWRPETVDSFEIGYKASFGNGSTSLRAAAFHYDYSDFQVSQVIGIQGSITNAGDAEIDGLELELSSSLNDNWDITGGLTLLDTAYGDFLNTDTLNAAAGTQQLKGNPLSYAPDTSINLGLTYNTNLAQGGNLSFSVDGSYRSRVYFREFNNTDDSTGAYSIFNLNANWRSADNLWAGRLFVRNATDEAYVTNIQGSNTTYGRQGTWNMPRQVGVEFTRFFGAR